jgi:TonB-linked SusC/RagA family outer membrane protein
MRLLRLRRMLGAALLLAGILAGTGAEAQEPVAYTISGTVVDATSQRPLANVAVSFRETGLGAGTRTVTDNAGRYTLNARVRPGTYTLQYTLVGRGDASRRVTLGAQREVQVETVPLQETALQLEGIVVTGTGAPTERRALGNTVSTVVGQEINEAPAAATIDQALQGKIAGAQISQNSGAPGGGVSIRLRGTSSILGGAEPLIVVDGVFVENNADALVSVGANATRGGAAMANRLADLAPSDIERIEVLKGAAAAALYGSRANNGVIQIFTKRGSEGRPVLNFRTEMQASEAPDRYDLLMFPQAARTDVAFGPAKKVGDPVERFDIQDQIFRTGYGVDNSLSISGGNEGTTYYLSGYWRDEEGIIRGTDYGKVGARVKVSQRLWDRLEVTGNANYLRTRTNYIPEGEQTQGALTSLIFTPTSVNPAFDPNLGRFPHNPLGFANPLDVVENFKTEVEVSRFIGNLQATYTPTPNLTVTYLLGLDDSQEEDYNFQPRFSISSRFTGLIQNPVRAINRWNNDLTANHEWSVRDGLGLSTAAGFRYTSDHVEVVRAAASDIPPGQTVIGGATQFASQAISELNTVSGFLQERVTLGDRLFVTGGLNVEAASAFGEDERWQLFPRIGVSYLLDQEPFWQNSAIANVLNTFRLRASYGETGGQPPGAFIRFDNYGDVVFSGRPGLVPSSVAGNPDLKPERQREWEGGFDATLFSDRIGLEFTVYDQETSDLVLLAPLPNSSGFSSQYQNIGVLSNRGIELALNTINYRSRNFNWSSRLTYSTNRNQVEQLLSDADTLVFGYLNAVIVGQPVGVFYGGYYERDAQGQIVVDAKGFPVRARDPRTGRFANKVIGDPTPDFSASLNNTFDIGANLQLGFLLDGRFGNDVANFTRRITQFFGTDASVEREIKGEVPVGFFTLNRNRIGLYEEYIEDGSFVKLREASLSYTLAESWARRVGAERVALRLAGRNLFTWTDYTGLDPEINLFSASTVARGVDFATTPIPRSVVLGLNFTF